MIHKGRAYARVGFLGNPSDGFFGKTISFTLSNFRAEALLYESPELEILPGPRDHARFRSLHQLLSDIRSSGYYGGLRLIKASIKKFSEYCSENGIRLPRKNFTIRYSTSIPRGVGLGGSSAIITAVFRALMSFYEVDIPQSVLPNLILASETEELGIPAGLQDRVVQVYEGLVYMNFARELMEKYERGEYEVLDSSLLPTELFVAYCSDAGQPSEKPHGDVKKRYERGDREVTSAMEELARIAEEGRECLKRGDEKRLSELIDANFDIRSRIFPLVPLHREMVTIAKKVGASAKFTGSGGAVVGIYRSKTMLKKLESEYRRIGAKVIIPKV